MTVEGARPGLTPATEPQHGGPPVALAQGIKGVAGRGRRHPPQDFDSCLQTGGGINPPRPELAALGQLLDGGGHHLGRQASGGPLLRLDGFRLQLQHAVQVKRLGVPLDGGLPPLLGGASPSSSLVSCSTC